jgi:thymidylate synthase ThyX
MPETGTLAPLQNKRPYTENEKIVLLHFFSNVDRNVYVAKNTLSSQLRAFLLGQYSRSTLSMRDRFLQLFEDGKKAIEEGKITPDEYVSLDEVAKMIQHSQSFTLNFFEEKAANFLKKRGVDYGHNSLKDADRIRFALEGVSEVFTKVVESPFPALGDFQEKSTRYLSFSKETLIIPNELQESPYGNEIITLMNEIMDIYI